MSAEPQRPSVAVNYHFGAADKRQVEEIPAGRFGLGVRRTVNQFTEGSLVIDKDRGRHQEVIPRLPAEKNK